MSLHRIRRLDGSIRAWVQVRPQPQSGDGPLSGSAYGAKDIIETQNLVTEYGSPIYKGRRGSSNAAIVRPTEEFGRVISWKDPHGGLCAYYPLPDTQSAKLGPHAGRKLQWIRRRSGEREGKGERSEQVRDPPAELLQADDGDVPVFERNVNGAAVDARCGPLPEVGCLCEWAVFVGEIVALRAERLGLTTQS